METHRYGDTSLWRHIAMETHRYGDTSLWRHIAMETMTRDVSVAAPPFIMLIN